MAVLIGLALTAEYFTPGEGKASRVYQLFLVTFAGNWSPSEKVDPLWNAVTGWLALLVNLGPLIALVGIFWVVIDQKERTMNALNLIEVLNDLVEVQVAKAVADELHIDDKNAQKRLLNVVSRTVKKTRDEWADGTIERVLGPERAAELKEHLNKEV